MSRWNNEKTEDLARTLLALENSEEVKFFLRDLLTEAEIIEFGRRWQAAQMLDGKVSYSQIIKKTGLSSTTVARISKWLKNGKGGYQLVLDRIKLAKNNLHHHDFSSLQKGS